MHTIELPGDPPTLGQTARRAGLVAAVGLAVAVAAFLAGASHLAVDALLLGAALVVGELFVLRIDGEVELPLSYAVVLVVASGVPVGTGIACIVVAQLVAGLVRLRPIGTRPRVNVLVRRVVVGGLTVLTVHAAERVIGTAHGARTQALGGLVAGIVAIVVVDLATRALYQRRSSVRERGRTAWAALLSSGALMALGYRPEPGGAGFGLWGPLLFSVPLWFAWYSFVRLDGVQRTYLQTVEALSCAPELGGMVVPGHAARVAALAARIADELDLGEQARRDLDSAARLHHVGQVTLDDPEVLGRPNSPAEVAAMSAAMLRDLGPLSAAAAIVAGEPLAASDDARWHGAHVRVLSQVLKAASAFDDLTTGQMLDAPDALEALAANPGEYDSDVLDGLARAVAVLAGPAAVPGEPVVGS